MNQVAKTKKIFDGRYEIISIVGRGARSVVYHARPLSTPSSSVAIKVLVDNKGKNPSAERLRREALAMVSCRHKYIARLDDFHSVGSLCYLSMEYCPESDLRKYCSDKGGKLDLSQAERFLKQTIEGIAFVHKAGILHRDIKPENILVVNDREIRITDFGVALLPNEQCSIADLQSGVGTMNYMAPEILEGKSADARSDVYAIGVVFYEMLSGLNPFDNAHLAEQIAARMDNRISPLRTVAPHIPEYLAEVIGKAIKFNQLDRYQTAEEMLQDLLEKRSSFFEKNINKSKRKASGEHQQQKRNRASQADRKAATEQKIVDISNSSEKSGISSNPEYQNPVPEEVEQHEQASQKSPEKGGLGDAILAEAIDSQKANFMTTDKKDTISEQETKAFEHPSFKKTVSLDRKSVEKFRAQTPTPKTKKKPEFVKDLKTSLILAVAVILCLIVIVPGAKETLFGLANKHLGISLASNSQKSPIPLYAGGELSFPALPSGLYSGNIDGLIPGQNYPISLVSFAEQDKLAVLVGLEGWTPVVISPRATLAGNTGSAAKPLRVASNGFILDLTGQNVDGEVFGYFRNVMTGTQGEWRVKPARRG